jgi:hypothetical protein
MNREVWNLCQAPICHEMLVTTITGLALKAGEKFGE